MKKRIAFQLIAGFTGIVTVAVLIIGLIFIGLYQRAALDTKRDDMINRARNLAPLLTAYMDGSGTWRGIGSFFRMMDAVNDAQIWIIDDTGEVISLPAALCPAALCPAPETPVSGPPVPGPGPQGPQGPGLRGCPASWDGERRFTTGWRSTATGWMPWQTADSPRCRQPPSKPSSGCWPEKRPPARPSAMFTGRRRSPSGSRYSRRPTRCSAAS